MEEENTEQKIQAWRFWFSVVLTCFLVVTFVFYLPVRFRYNELTQPQVHQHRSVSSEAESIKSGLSVDMSIISGPTTVGTDTYINFFVNEKPSRTPVVESALQKDAS